jgi:hypothetical protein
MAERMATARSTPFPVRRKVTAVARNRRMIADKLAATGSCHRSRERSIAFDNSSRPLRLTYLPRARG